MESYNYSALSAAYKCNRYFKYLYVDRLETPKNTNADLVFGSAFHFALEQYFMEGLPLMESFLTYWASEASKLDYGRYDQASLESTASILFDRFERLHAKKFKKYQMEQRLYGKLGEISVEGTPDFLGDYEGTPSVVDFKTASYRYPKERIMLNEQMYLYAHLAKQNGYNPTQIVFIVFIKGNTPSIQTLTLDLKDDEVSKVLENVRIQCDNLTQLQKTNTWSYNSNSCQMGERKCPFFDKCWKGGSK